jgi:predicted RNA-binding Zn-ribbon protein involved in translation (DUF1610 family)
MSTWETFRCPNCTEAFEVRIDLSFDRRLLISCPKCGHEQRVEIKAGHIAPTDETPK